MKEDTRDEIKESYEKLIPLEEDIRRYSNELSEAAEYCDSIKLRKVQEELGKILSLLEGVLFSNI